MGRADELAQVGTVMLVDDDRGTRESLTRLLQCAGIEIDAYATPDELLEVYDPRQPGCLIIDLQLPGMTGAELLVALREKGGRHPFIMIAGQVDVSTAVQAMRNGAFDFLEKPFEHQRLIDGVRQAIETDVEQRRRTARRDEIQTRLDALTPREREVVDFVAQGLLTKQIALKLGISERTVEVHRSRATKKMEVRSVAQLVRLLNELQ